jgi:ribosomal protein L31
MNTFIKTTISAIMFTMAVAVVGTSCKKKFDAPPAEEPPTNMTANTTIAQLKARHTVPGAIDKIDSGSEIIIRGIVIGDDRSGNLYKTIVIQDSTGGIALNINGTNLYTSYPIGREIFVKCNNLYLSDYNKQIQLGGGIQTGTTPALADIPTTTINNVIFKGSVNNVVTPKDVTPAQLGTNMDDPYQNTLIRLTGVEFSSTDTAKTFASPGVASPSAASFRLYSCNSTPPFYNSSINTELRTSNYSNFAGVALPNGNGTITAIYTIFGNSKQLTIRDVNDVKFDGARCGPGTGPGPGGPVTLANISTIRALHTGTTTSAPASTKITGIVISDRAALNTQAQNLVIQQGTGLSGIVVRFTATHNFDLGDSIDITVSSAEISLFSGLLQLNNVPLANATRVSTGKVITPRVATAAQVTANVAQWESTLVKLENVTISKTSGTNWSGTTKFTDASGSVDHFTRTGTTGATFGNANFPTGVRPSVTAIVSKFNTTVQVGIRNPADVQ